MTKDEREVVVVVPIMRLVEKYPPHIYSYPREYTLNGNYSFVFNICRYLLKK